MKLIAVVMILVGLCTASDTSSCPVHIIGAAAGYADAECPYRTCLWINMENQQAKKVVGAKFGVQFIDAVGDPHESIFHYTSNDSVKPSKKHMYQWVLTGTDAQDVSNGASAWVEKLLFEDGSKWEDDGNKRCQWTRPKFRK